MPENPKRRGQSTRFPTILKGLKRQVNWNTVQIIRVWDGRWLLVVERNSAKLTTMESDAEAEVLRLDDAWNGAYRRHDRAPLESILADDFTALTPSGESITKASLMVNPSEIARSVTFSEQAVQVFGKTAITRGRLQLDLNDRCVDQRFLRVFTCRNGTWRVVSVAVTPLA